MLFRFLRRCFNTKPAKRAKVKLPVHAPNSSAKPILLDNGCTFIELNSSSASNPVVQMTSPPLAKNYGGLVVSQSSVNEMKQLRAGQPERWTVTQLSKRFQVSRSFVISNVFSPEERDTFKGEIDEMITNMSIKQQRGWILRHKIKADRDASW